MTCGKCPEGRRFSGDGVYCVLYGMIIRASHICTRDGGYRHEGEDDGGHGEDRGRDAELQEDGGDDAPEMPGFLRGSGE